MPTLLCRLYRHPRFGRVLAPCLPALALFSAKAGPTTSNTAGAPPAPPPVLSLAAGTIRAALQSFGAATIAIAMLVAGSRFAMLRFETMLGWRVWLVSAIRLLAVPLVMIPLLRLVPLGESARGILFIIAVMPSAMVSVLFSERYGGDTDFIAGGLLLTHLWAVVTVPLFLAWAL